MAAQSPAVIYFHYLLNDTRYLCYRVAPNTQRTLASDRRLRPPLLDAEHGDPAPHHYLPLPPPPTMPGKHVHFALTNDIYSPMPQTPSPSLHSLTRTAP